MQLLFFTGKHLPLCIVVRLLKRSGYVGCVCFFFVVDPSLSQYFLRVVKSHNVQYFDTD